MTQKNSQYFRDLSNGKLSLAPIKPILDHMGKIMRLEKIPKELLRSGTYGSKVTEQLTRLDLRIVEGNKTWEGLAVAFPGDRHERTYNFSKRSSCGFSFSKYFFTLLQNLSAVIYMFLASSPVMKIFGS